MNSAFFFVFSQHSGTVLCHGTEDPWPEDLKRSYFLTGHLRPMTPIAVSDPALPMPLTNSGYINHHGELVFPD